MSTYYVACDLGAQRGRVSVGALNKGKLQLTEAHRFPNVPTADKHSLYWDIPQLYGELIEGLRQVGTREDPINSVSCDSWAADYLLFDHDGSLIPPTYHHDDPRAQAGMEEVLGKVPWETIYSETGIHRRPVNTLFQLGAEKSRRLGRANRLMPVADGFNYLLSGQARIEASLASTTQLYNPMQQTWSERLLNALRFPQRLLPPVVSSGTVLGPLRADLARETGLEDVKVVASCSHDMAAALVALPIISDADCAFLRVGLWSHLGAEVPFPIVESASRELNFTNEVGYGGTVLFQKRVPGLWLVQECQRYWAEREQDFTWEVMTHLASSSPPFQSLINPADAQFLAPSDMPLKIKAYCRETQQPAPRGPGATIRCVLESLALYYRKVLKEVVELTGQEIKRLHLLSDGMNNTLLNHFIANALQIPVVVGPAEAASVGNMLVQAIALGHLESLEQARKIVRDSFKFQTIQPHALAWNAAYERLQKLS